MLCRLFVTLSDDETGILYVSDGRATFWNSNEEREHFKIAHISIALLQIYLGYDFPFVFHMQINNIQISSSLSLLPSDTWVCCTLAASKYWWNALNNSVNDFRCSACCSTFGKFDRASSKFFFPRCDEQTRNVKVKAKASNFWKRFDGPYYALLFDSPSYWYELFPLVSVSFLNAIFSIIPLLFFLIFNIIV